MLTLFDLPMIAFDLAWRMRSMLAYVTLLTYESTLRMRHMSAKSNFCFGLGLLLIQWGACEACLLTFLALVKFLIKKRPGRAMPAPAGIFEIN